MKIAFESNNKKNAATDNSSSVFIGDFLSILMFNSLMSTIFTIINVLAIDYNCSELVFFLLYRKFEPVLYTIRIVYSDAPKRAMKVHS